MRRILFLGLCLVGVLSPVIYFTDITFLYNEKRIIVSGLLILAGLSVAFISNKKLKKVHSLLPGYVWWGILISLLLLSISILQTEYPVYGIVEVGLYLLLFWVALITANITNSHKYGRYAVITSACFLVFFYVLKFSLGYTFYLLEFKDFPLWPANGIKTGVIGFVNIRFFNQVQVFTLPLLLGGALFAIQKQKLAGYFLLVLSANWWMLLIESAGRGVFLSTLTAALIVLYFFRESTHRWMWHFLGTLLLGYFLKILLFDIIPPDTGFSKSIIRGGSPRVSLYPKTFFASLNRPLLGHGPMAFANINSDFFRGHPHNSILQLLYEFGYPVTIVIGLGGIYGIKQWLEQTQKLFSSPSGANYDQTIIRVSLTVALLGGLLYSLLSGVIVMPLSQLWLALVFGTMVGLYTNHDSKEEHLRPINIYKVIGVKLLILLASISLISILIKDVPHLRENEQRFVEETDRHVFRPRFWQQGKIGLDQMPNIDEKSNTKSNL